jgi:7-keto-8-aminopelargonate synthetase-like enzyme
MKTEADIASCLGTEGCIVYAQAFSTISSVIPAFSKRGDIIVADRAVNYSIRKGLQICRSTIRYYDHNNMEDLERVLQKVVKEQAKKPLTRRFIVTEGLFETVGDVVDLPKLVRSNARGFDHTTDNMYRLSSNFVTSSASCWMKPGHSLF